MKWLSFLAIWLSQGCGIVGPDSGTTRTLAVAPHKGSCYSLFARLCLRVRAAEATGFSDMYDSPEGFEYEWGFDYLITVREETVDDRPADGSWVRRRLVQVLSKTAVAPGSSFELALFPEGLHPTAVADRYSVYSGPEEVICAGTQRCQELADAVARGSGIGLVLRYPAYAGGPFEVVAWTECLAGDGPCGPSQ